MARVHPLTLDERRKCISMRLAQAKIERLRSFVAGTNFELDLVAFAQIIELNFGIELRTMEKNLIGAVVRDDEAEAFVLDYFLDRAKHRLNTSVANRLQLTARAA